MTPTVVEKAARRSGRAMKAAVAAARDLGLEVAAPRVLHDAFSLVVHLAPTSIVARVPTVLPPPLAADREGLLRRQGRELAVASWLAERGHRVVAPSPLVPARPVWRDGFAMTLWELAELDDEAEPDYVRESGRAAELHAALGRYDAELPFLSPVSWIAPCLDELAGLPEFLPAADLDRARREWARLEPIVGSSAGFEAAFPGVTVQPLHGDSPWYNVLATRSGPVHADFEDVCVGPVEWDVLSGPDGEKAYDAAACRCGLRRLDERVLRCMHATAMLRGVCVLGLAPRLPSLVEDLRPVVERWRAAPFAGGFAEWEGGELSPAP